MGEWATDVSGTTHSGPLDQAVTGLEGLLVPYDYEEIQTNNPDGQSCTATVTTFIVQWDEAGENPRLCLESGNPEIATEMRNGMNSVIRAARAQPGDGKKEV